MPRLEGVVLGSGNRPVSQAAVFILGGPDSPGDIGALTGHDGTFGLTVAAPGTYRVGVFAEGVGTTEVEVSVAGDRPEPVRIRIDVK